MAKRKANGVNKSEAIREILRGNRKTPVKEIVGTLGAKGIDVKPTLVYFIKARMKMARRKQIRQDVAKNSNINPVQFILKVKSLAEEAGGIRHLKQLVDALAES